MKKLVYLLAITTVVLSFAGCNKDTKNESESVTFEDSSDISETMYMGDNGWNVTYDEQFFDMNEIKKGQAIELIYKGECSGSAYVELNMVKGKSAKELIEEKKSEYESTSEMYEAGRENESGYVFYVPDIVPAENEGNDRYTSVEVLDIKDGALVITTSQMMDEKMEVSDRLSDIINSIEY